MEKTGLDHIAILRGMWRRHKRLMAGVFLAITAPLLTLVYISDQPLFESRATIAIDPSPVEQLPFMRDIPRRDFASLNMLLLRSHSLTEAVVEALPKESFEELLTHSQYTDYLLVLTNKVRSWLGQPPTVMSPQQRAVAELQKARMEFVQPREPVGIFLIKGTASNARVAMDLVNTYIQVLIGRTRNASHEDARKSREFLEQQTQQVKENLGQAEETLTKFQNQKGRIRLGTQTELDLARLVQVENALAEAQASREVLTARIAGHRRSLGQGTSRDEAADAQPQRTDAEGGPPALPKPETLARLSAFKAAQDRLAALEAKLNTLRERYTDAHPLVRVTQEEVTSLQARIAQLARELPATTRDLRVIPAAPSDRVELRQQLTAMEKEDATLQTRLDTLKVQEERLRKNLRNLSQDELEFGNLRRTVEANRNLLTVLSDRLMGARIREQSESSSFRIIDPASFPLLPTRSQTQKLMILILVLAGGTAFGLAFGVEFWRQPIETDTDVVNATGLTVLGSVGILDSSSSGDPAKKRTAPGSAPASSPAKYAMPAGIPLELYRTIRAAIETERLRSSFRSILVTSPGPSEGKSTTTLNLAHVFREFGRSVLVIEADLRRPVLRRGLSLENRPGLVDFLDGTASFEQICHTLPSGVNVIAGQVPRGDIGSLLASPRYRELMDVGTKHFDLVLVDSPPLLAVADNLLLVMGLDRTILVVKANSTSKRDLQKALMTLEQANAQVLGVVVNRANPRDVPYYHPRYRKYYNPGDERGVVQAPRRHRIALWRGRE